MGALYTGLNILLYFSLVIQYFSSSLLKCALLYHLKCLQEQLVSFQFMLEYSPFRILTVLNIFSGFWLW